MEFDRRLTPSRLGILAALVPRDSQTFSELKQAAGLRDGNLHVHAKKLVAAGYVEARKVRRGGRTVTVFRISESGLHALRLHAQGILQLLAARGGVPEPKRPKRSDDSQVWLR